jgi:hypothetical protein
LKRELSFFSDGRRVASAAVKGFALLFALATIATMAATTAACGDPKPAPKEPIAQTTGSGTSPVERFFPLDDGKIYHYVTKDGPETGMIVAKVHRTDPTHGELRLSNATKRFAYSADGVSYQGGAFILRAPVLVGASWAGEHGGTTRIAAVDAAVDVPAGHYESCLRTVEEGGPNKSAAKYETTYCPGVGMVLLVVSAPGTEGGRAELKSYGMPFKIE